MKNTYTDYIEFGCLVEKCIRVDVDYRYCPGSPGRLYEPPYEPPEPATCEPTRVTMTLDGKPVPSAVVDWLDDLIDWESIGERLLEHYHDAEIAAAEDKADRDHEDRKLGEAA